MYDANAKYILLDESFGTPWLISLADVSEYV
jgi:hypothetical protein